MRDLNELYFFAKVVDHGGFSAAAQQLGIPKSRLSRHIAQLEHRLGVRLLNRTTRRVTLTELGRIYYQHCRDVLASADAADEAAERLRNEPSGLLKVTAPIGVADRDLAPILPGFLAKYPQIRLNLIITSRRVGPHLRACLRAHWRRRSPVMRRRSSSAVLTDLVQRGA